MKNQEIEKSKDFWIFVKVCIGIILVGITTILLKQPAIGINIVFAGTLMIVFAALFGKSHYFQDERSRRIREKAGYNAYGATLITIFLLLAFGNVLPLIKNATYNSVTAFIFFPGLVCFLIFSWYYNKKGDIE
ncbi:MAG: DUF2178 domain-containing protein [Candidatus Methanoperedens sp.]|nr:DUF2178 domain-containing protein [Candidatus Methanoperedens sp.]